jgi:Ca2+-binding EF-hand superfamily protein
MEEDKILQIFNSLNNFRKNPSSYVKELELISKSFERAGQSKEGKELFALTKKLSMEDAKPQLVNSSNLTKVCKDKVTMLLKGQKESEDEKVERLERHISGFSNYKEMIINGSDLETFLGKIFVSEYDPNRNNKNYILDKSFVFTGIALGKKDDVDVIVIALTDSLIEKSNKPLAEQIFDNINLYRKFPYKAKNFLSTLLEDKKAGKDFKADLEKFIGNISNKALSDVKREPVLDELCIYLYEKVQSKEFSDIGDLNTLTYLAKNSIHGFNKIYCYISPEGNKSPSQILLGMLANPKEKDLNAQNLSRELLNNKNISHIGIDVICEHEKNTQVVIVAVDSFYRGSERDYSSYMEDELNRLREQPQSYINDLIAWKNQIDGKTYRGEAIKEVNKFIEYLKKKQNPISPLKNNAILNKACEEYQFFGSKGKYYPEDDDILASRLSYYISGHSKVKVFIDTGCTRPEHFISELLVSEHDKDKLSRKTLLDEDYKHFGVFHSEIDGDMFVALILVDNIEERSFSSIEENILFTINLARAHPRTLVKHILEYQAELVQKKESAAQNTYTKKRGAQNNNDILLAYDEKIRFCEEAIEFLAKTRIMGPLERIPILDKASETKISNIISDKENKCFLDSDLRDFLSDFASNFYYVMEIQGKADFADLTNDNSFNAGLFLAKSIIDSMSFDYLKKFFFFNFHKVGISFNKDASLIDVLIADHVIERPNFKIPVNLKQRINRPELTEDELEQIRYDFKRFDINEQGFIYPNTVLTFIDNSKRFLNNNPLYTEALRTINTIENNENGINVNMLIDSINSLIKKMEKKDWDSLYQIYLRDSEQREVNLEAYKFVSKRLNYEMGDTELSDAFERILGDKDKFNKEEFIRTMMIVHKTYKEEEETS